ncbi:MAG TPA: DUF1552 domain-containing protein [Polyangiaceae bacterium]|nr:DUF1552 domain-containing protein [Polyangiaceae bacterium]
MKTVLDRRTLLRGVLSGAAIAVGLPTLEAMLNGNGTALAAGQPLPKRLGVFFWGNGVKVDRWVPGTTGPDWTPSSALEPLTGVKDYVSVVTGMDIKTGNERGHHSGTVGILSGAPMISLPHPNSNYVSTFSAPSIDQVAAAAIGTSTRFPSLEVGISRRVVKGEGTTLWYLSHNGPENVNPPEYDPAALYERLFGAGFTPPDATPVVDATLALRKSALDAVMADLQSLKQKVSSFDRQRLEQHLDNVRAIEARLGATALPPSVGASCGQPSNPGSVPDQDRREQIAEKMQAMSDLIAMALACDQTRVFSVMFTGSVGSTVFWQVGADKGHHDLTHDEAGDQPLVHETTVFTMKQLATLLETLKSIPEGDGNLLDRSVILASSDTADGRNHTIRDYPIVVAGRAGGALAYPGVHYRSDGENTSKVLLSVLRAAGADLDEFGVDGGHVTEGCSAIEA